MSNFETGTLNYNRPLNSDINLNTLLKVVPTEGNLVYEYNPFRNYRLEVDMYEYQNHMYTLQELELEFNISISNNVWTKDGTELTNEVPLLVEAGSLVNFETDQLSFDINHPVDILPQYSYDGSVNLIFNDGKNIPRLVNSRFTYLTKNTYKIIDRKGNNDTNIYDQGGQFDIDTSLYKRVVEIPKLEFLGIESSGNLDIGNYNFYFKYSDSDGNETDFVAESGNVVLFIGTDLRSITSGIRDENSYKSVRFILSNIDSGYSYVNVYYTRNTSDVDGNVITKAYRINKQYDVNRSLICNLNITGVEDVSEIPLTDINTQYNIASSVEAQSSCQNMLFLGNIHKANVDYQELTDLALRFTPTVATKEYQLIEHDYSNDVTNTYSDPNFIYKFTSYANGELYRLGVVFIMSDNSLSPTFNIRGKNALTSDRNQYTSIPVYKADGTRSYVSSDETNGVIIKTEHYTPISSASIENVWGIVKLQQESNDSTTIYGLRINIDHEVDVMKQMKKYGIKGFFFVRQKRIPIKLCQALTIGLDKYSKIPVLPVSPSLINSYKGTKFDTQKPCYIAERFLNNDRVITEDFIDRIYPIDSKNALVRAAICPDFDVNPSLYNQLFSGNTYYFSNANFQSVDPWLIKDSSEDRHFFVQTTYKKLENAYYATKVIALQDSTPTVSLSDQTFKGKAGEAEEGYKFAYLERKNKVKDASNLVRGAFGPYLGILGYENPLSIVNINTSDAYNTSIYELFDIRHTDKSPYYAISDRYAISDIVTPFNEILYRGDSYICTFTHRINRNFQDPESPNNNEIVDSNIWKDNYSIDDQEQLGKINRGDVNAVPLGMWVTFSLVSSANLNIRTLDGSYPSEEGLTGHKRGFYPIYGMDIDGSYKIPEALLHNGGFTKSLGERWNYNVPDVPYIKNNFETRIMYSDIHINDAFKNGFRVFRLSNYRDYPRTYGSITKLVELFGNILCVFEHGVALIPVNERIQSGEGAGGNVFINTSNVLPENPKMLSDTFGTQWADSVVKTPYYVYGIDTIGKKIWRTNGSQFEVISDFKVQQFLNDNITITEREMTPIIGIRNIKSHYNKFKQDVMFTFYDNLHGFEEKVWNLCYNEIMQKFVTFYSWVPSYSANIDNIFFSFDRNTSKLISKLGVSHTGSQFAEGITINNNYLRKDTNIVGICSLSNVQLPSTVGTDITIAYKWSIERDNFGNYKYFSIDSNSGLLKLIDSTSYNYFIANIFSIDPDTGTRIFKDPNDTDYSNRLMALLNIRCEVNLSYTGNDNNIKQYANKWNAQQSLNLGYYESSIGILPEDNLKFLTTDFWKHGQAGIIDIADSIKPTKWYGKQHPFEFEFVIVDGFGIHKIFENLQIISNKAAPESFHFEIVGEVYDFAKDKANMYFRQEATKSLYQYNGSDILYNRNYLNVKPSQIEVLGSTYKGKSTMFPLFYSRVDTIDEIEDYYQTKTSISRNYQNLSGSEIVYDKGLDEFRIATHIKNCPFEDFYDQLIGYTSSNTPIYEKAQYGRLRGNSNYQEDKWLVQIPSITYWQKNEATWEIGSGNKWYPPLNLANNPLPKDMKELHINSDDNIPSELRTLGYRADLLSLDVNKWENAVKETRIRDKYIKIKVRYSGEDLAVITALKTLYTISYA